MRYWRSWASVATLVFAAIPAAAQPKARDRYAEVNGVKLHYMESGKGNVVLFLHGFPEFWYAWKEAAEDLSKDYRAIALDMRGYNKSSRPSDIAQYRLPVLVEDVRALAEKLGAKKFTLVGHGQGGVVAWAFAAEHPAMLDYLVVVNAAHPTLFAREVAKNPEQQKASLLDLFRSEQAEATLAANDFQRLRSIFTQRWASDDMQREYVSVWKRGLSGGLNYYRAWTDAPALKRITVPTLLIWGDRDPMLTAGNLEGLQEHVKDLTVKRIKDGTHWVVHEKPGLVIGYIRDFIRP